MPRARRVLSWVIPYGAVRLYRHRCDEREGYALAASISAERRERLDRYAQRVDPQAYDYEASIALLVSMGLDEDQVRDASVPEASLEWIATRLRAELSHQTRAPVVLHVGNFVGVSLVYITHVLRELHPDALVISVDPGMPHRNVEQPELHVREQLQTFGLTANSIVINGYSRLGNARNDGLTALGDVVFPQRAAGIDAACEEVVPNLARLLGPTIDAVMLDGNHDGIYLRDELEPVARLLRPRGLLVLDDVTQGWKDIAEVFESLRVSSTFDGLEYDGRVGVARRSLSQWRSSNFASVPFRLPLFGE